MTLFLLFSSWHPSCHGHGFRSVFFIFSFLTFLSLHTFSSNSLQFLVYFALILQSSPTLFGSFLKQSPLPPISVFITSPFSQLSGPLLSLSVFISHSFHMTCPFQPTELLLTNFFLKLSFTPTNSLSVPPFVSYQLS